MQFRVAILTSAERDLDEIYDFVRVHNPDAAIALTRQLRQACVSLREMPYRGVPRDDISPGLRTLAVQRRAVIAYRVQDPLVEVSNILYGGRDYEAILRDREDPT